MDKIYTVEWSDLPNKASGWVSVRTLEEAQQQCQLLSPGVQMLPVTKEMFAELQEMPIESPELAGMLPAWWNAEWNKPDSAYLVIEEYTEESAGPMRWRMFLSKLRSEEDIALDNILAEKRELERPK